jgi:hypothetical protein
MGYKVDANLLLSRLQQTSRGGLNIQDDQRWWEGLGRAATMNATGTARKPPKRLWVVVKIERDVPVMIDAYLDKRSANRRADFLRRHMRPNSENVELFAIEKPKLSNP